MTVNALWSQRWRIHWCANPSPMSPLLSAVWLSILPFRGNIRGWQFHSQCLFDVALYPGIKPTPRSQSKISSPCDLASPANFSHFQSADWQLNPPHLPAFHHGLLLGLSPAVAARGKNEGLSGRSGSPRVFPLPMLVDAQNSTVPRSPAERNKDATIECYFDAVLHRSMMRCRTFPPCFISPVHATSSTVLLEHYTLASCIVDMFLVSRCCCSNVRHVLAAVPDKQWSVSSTQRRSLRAHILHYILTYVSGKCLRFLAQTAKGWKIAPYKCSTPSIFHFHRPVHVHISVPGGPNEQLHKEDILCSLPKIRKMMRHSVICPPQQEQVRPTRLCHHQTKVQLGGGAQGRQLHCLIWKARTVSDTQKAVMDTNADNSGFDFQLSH